MIMFVYSYCYVCSLLDILFHCDFCVLFVCKCIQNYCHRLLTQFFLSPGATTPIGGCILQPSSGL